MKQYGILEYFKEAVRSCDDVSMANYPHLFLNVSAAPKKVNLFSKLSKKLVRDIMTFVVRLHYANYLNQHLYKIDSKFDFKTYPQLKLVFSEMENELDLKARSIARKDKSALPVVGESDGAASHAASENFETSDRLGSVVNNVCNALRDFEKYFRDTKFGRDT
jgi:hypothetical protein